MFKFTFQTIKDFFKDWTLVIPYEIIVKMLMVGIIMPILSTGFKGVLRNYGAGAVGNLEILMTLRSVPGVIFVILGTLVLAYLIFLEVGGMTIISASSITGEKLSLAQVFVGTHHYLKKLLSPAVILLVVYYFIFLPFVQLGMSTSLVQTITVPSFILNSVTSSALGSILVALASIAIFVLSLHWIFVIHYVIFKDLPLRKAFKASSNLVKSNRWQFIKFFGGGTLIVSLLQIIAYFIILMVPLLLSMFVEKEFTAYLSTSMTAIISNVSLSIMVNLLQIPIIVYMLTRLFYILDDSASLKVWKSSAKDINTPFGKFFYRHRRGFLATIIILSLAFFALVSSLFYFLDEKYPTVTVTAHRGASAFAPENTMSSLVKAVELGAKVAEIDIQELKDGTIVLFHDGDLNRTSGLSTKIYDLTKEDLATIDVGQWFDESFKGERIPTLEEVLKYSKGKIQLNIEIKKHGKEKALIENTIKLIKQYDMVNESFITSLDYETLEEVKAYDPSIRTGFVFFANFGDIKNYNVDIYSIEAQYVSEPLITEIHDLGREIHVWTVNDPDLARKFAILGVNSIISDELVIVGEVVNEVNQIEFHERMIEMMFIE